MLEAFPVPSLEHTARPEDSGKDEAWQRESLQMASVDMSSSAIYFRYRTIAC